MVKPESLSAKIDEQYFWGFMNLCIKFCPQEILYLHALESLQQAKAVTEKREEGNVGEEDKIDGEKMEEQRGENRIASYLA